MKCVLGSWASEQLRVVGPNILSFPSRMRKSHIECCRMLQACYSSCGQQNAITISRALKNDPEVALAIRRIRSSHFKCGPNKIKICQAILDILSQATLVETIHLQHIHATLMKGLSDVLCRLANIRKFSIFGQASSSLGRVNFSDLLSWVGRWKHLRLLTVHDFDQGVSL